MIRYRRGATHPSDPSKIFWGYQGSYEKWCPSQEVYDLWVGQAKVRSRRHFEIHGNSQSDRWVRDNPERSRFLLKRRKCSQENIEFTVPLSMYFSVPEVCPALGIPLKFSKGYTDNTPCLDRISPSGGYTPENVIWVSRLANIVKNDATPDTILRVADFYDRDIEVILGDAARAQHLKMPNARTLLIQKKSKAKKLGIPFDLPLSFFERSPVYCPVSGSLLPLKNLRGSLDNRGIDQITPRGGYTAGNCIWVSGKANLIKNSATPSQVRMVGLFYKALSAPPSKC